ncbi:hypothetical protein J2Z80_002481 [Thermoanaerobacterium butyriciformans]|uniref:DNA-binding response regulator n=1 Tax=Thermoanaerobacterium butyriciformans TaxID=1702242 RepID=A0ABS4NIN8_9THEO|nr:hypothetical protein [Thermoanaerobacterium butyriciformans]
MEFTLLILDDDGYYKLYRQIVDINNSSKFS